MDIEATLHVTKEIRDAIIGDLTEYEKRDIVRDLDAEELYDMMTISQQDWIEGLVKPEEKEVEVYVEKEHETTNDDVITYFEHLQNYQKRDLICDILGLQRTVSKEVLLNELNSFAKKFS